MYTGENEKQSFGMAIGLGFFIDHKLKLQAIINNLSLDLTRYTQLLTELYKPSCKAVTGHKFCEVYDCQHVINFL